MTGPETTQGTLLGGRVRYEQFRHGYRTGIEPVLLAASIPARPGERVLEAGSGAGAALLCLAARIPGLHLTGLERDPAMAALARRNLAANGLDGTILQADVAAAPPRSFDHVLANPPWHDPASTRSPDPLRDAATHGAPAGLNAWTAPLAAALAPHGTLTLALRYDQVAEATALLSAAGLHHATLAPLWPRQGRPPRLALLRAQQGTRSVIVIPGLILHGPGSGYGAAAEAILRDGQPFPL